MAAISESIVREYFEMHGFLVRQSRKYVAPVDREDEEIDFLLLNPHPQSFAERLPFTLASKDLPFLERAVVVVKPWHREVFSPALLTSVPELLRFLEKKSFKRGVRAFAKNSNVPVILAIPALPAEASARAESVDLLRAKGIEAVVTFRTMLGDLVNEVEPNRNYQNSDILQLIRILKNYGFLKEPQLELFRPGRRTKAAEVSKA